MPRQKKEPLVAPVIPAPVAVAAAAAVPPQQQHLVIDRQNFMKVRDSVYARLSTIQDLIKSFSIDYLRQTNLLLGEPTSLDNGMEFDQIGNAFSAMVPSLIPQVVPVEEKKERKKRTHDPNAPKRPLTPYFLYMQTARPIIASDLGPEAPKGAVQEEGQRRWAVMTATEKQGWNQAYAYNLRLYNARVHSYKRGNPNAKNMTDDEALKYADEANIEVPLSAVVEEVVGNDHDAIAEQLQQGAAVDADDDVDEEEEEEEEAPPVVKTPKKGKETRKRKTATPGEAEATKAAAATPEKKRKRTSKAAEMEEPKKSGRKKSKSG